MAKKIIGGLFVIGLIGSIFNGPKIQVENGTLKITTTVINGIGLGNGVHALLKDVHDAVHAHPDVTRVEARLNVDASGLSDRYGNSLKDDIEIGRISFGRADIEQILKFKKNIDLASDNEYKGRTAALISIGGQAYLLE